jgi:endoglucanase
MKLATVLTLAAGLAASAPPALAAEPPPRGAFLFATEPAAGGGCRALSAEHPAWQNYRTRFVMADGRVVDNANGGISHSEGQGYALLLAVAFRDQATFKLVWRWTKANLGVRDDGLFAWRWEPGIPHVPDTNNATDGDLLIAWALAEAHDRWGDEQHLVAARALAKTIYEKATFKFGEDRLILPAVAGFGDGERPDGPVVNPSYWVFPALERLDAAAPGQDWRTVAQSGLKLLKEAQFGILKLPPEWVALKEERPKPASGFPRVFGYNAIRVPLYLAMMQAPPVDPLRPYPPLWSVEANVGPAVIDLDTSGAVEPLTATGYRRVILLASRIVRPKRALPPLPTAPDTLYYPATLGLLADVLFNERSWKCL